MFFFLKRHFKVNESYLIDSNPELILAFRVVQKDPETLIQALQDLEKTYFCLSEKKRSEFFYHIRNQYNVQRYHLDYHRYNKNWITRASG